MEGPVQGGSDKLRAGDMAGALAWWREAGVDNDFAETARPWLTPPADDQSPAPPAFTPVGSPVRSPPGSPVAAPAATIGGDPAHWPTDLAAFAQWWLDEPSLDDGALDGRVPPRGTAGADLMIVVGQPDPEDGPDLLSGAQGRLLSAMLAAMGVPMTSVYLASALPRHRPAPDWADLGARGLGAIMQRHVHLVGPERLLVFGEGVLSLLGHDPAQSAQNSPQLYHDGQTMPLLGARELASLARPASKARFWRDWLDWTGTDTQ